MIIVKFFWKSIMKISVISLIQTLILSTLLHASEKKRTFVCPPCYHDYETYKELIFHKDGQCDVCGMNLIELNSITSNMKIDIHVGSGNFHFYSDRSSINQPIDVYYYRPESMTKDSTVLMVLPGASRNAWDYRDDWIQLADRLEVLILAPAYTENQYGFEQYHLLNTFPKIKYEISNQYSVDGVLKKLYIDEKLIDLAKPYAKGEWLTHDFDQLFKQVKLHFNLSKQQYDVFGHSAGAQIIHRWVTLNPSMHVRHYIAANAGFYTGFSEEKLFPIGLKGLVEPWWHRNSLKQSLILLVGELDNKEETRGTMLHSKTLDSMGLGRLERARSHIRQVKEYATDKNIQLNWQFKQVKGVGHNHRQMAAAAAKLLYKK